MSQRKCPRIRRGDVLFFEAIGDEGHCEGLFIVIKKDRGKPTQYYGLTDHSWHEGLKGWVLVRKVPAREVLEYVISREQSLAADIKYAEQAVVRAREARSKFSVSVGNLPDSIRVKLSRRRVYV